MMNRFIKINHILVLGGSLLLTSVHAQDITITVDAAVNKKTVSPYVFGRNESFDKPATFYKDAGLRFARMNAGNNATKYNWRKKITSHPDWYNNVYSYDWDAASKKVATNHPDMKVMWAFQLIGKVASSMDNNFNDWSFNNSQWWEGVGQNLAGGGTPDLANPNGKALVEGDISKYLMNWPVDSTVEILNHWFGANGIYATLELSALSATETFKSHTDNTLKKNTVTVISNSFIITVPALSSTAVLLAKATTGISEFKNGNSELKIFPNPAKDNINVSLSPAIGGQTEITVYDMMGRKILNSFVDYNGYSPLSFDISTLERGVYFLSIINKHDTSTKKFSVIK